jgi:hypothetical protein
MSVQQIVFDQYSRYRACGELAKIALGSNASTVLDVGSGSLCLLGRFLPFSKISYLDPLISQEDESHFAGTIFCSPVRHQQFQLVASVDTFEHVQRNDRSAFLKHLSACASECLIIGFPANDGGIASAVDASVADAYGSFFPGQHEWLREHEAFGLPSAADVVLELEQMGWKCTTVGHGHAPWLKQFLSAILPAWEVEDLKLEVFQLSEALNDVLFPFEFHAPSYRTFVVATKRQCDAIISIPTPLSKTEADAIFAQMMEKFKEDCIRKLVSVCKQRDDCSQTTAHLNAQVKQLQSELVMMQDSWSWKLTQPLRRLKIR